MDIQFKNMLKDDFLIEREIKVNDGFGGFSSRYKKIGIVKGRLDEEKYNERFLNQKDIVLVTHRLFLDNSVDIRRNDKISGLNRVLRVIMLCVVHEDFPLEVLCEEIDP
jgi:hypothetical protein